MPKQVVIVLDASQSMDRGQRLDLLAKNGVKTVLRMLSQADSVGLVYFTDHAHQNQRDSCLGEKLAQMTAKNREKLENDLDKHYKTRGGNTNYGAGLEEVRPSLLLVRNTISHCIAGSFCPLV